MPDGGMVASRCHYVGRAGRVEISGLRVAGLSGVFSPAHLRERPPVRLIASVKKKLYTYFTEDDVTRVLDAGPADVLLVHDWPSGVVAAADHPALTGRRRYSMPDGPGNGHARILVDLLAPRLVLAGHYRSWVTPTTRFVALGHVDTGRDAFAVFRVGSDGGIQEVAEEGLTVKKY